MCPVREKTMGPLQAILGSRASSQVADAARPHPEESLPRQASHPAVVDRREPLPWVFFAWIAAGTLLGGAVLVVSARLRDLSWYEDVEYRILCLAERKPGEVGAKQWASCIYWTWNLHASYGLLDCFDAHEKAMFLDQFDHKLRGNVDLATVDWIWDQYASGSVGAAMYSDRYRPTTPDRLENAARYSYQESRLDFWIERLNERRASRSIHAAR